MQLNLRNRLNSRDFSHVRFTDWITDEVLPSIRKNGGYIEGATETETKEIVKKFKASKYLTEDINDRKSLQSYIRNSNVMMLDETIEEIIKVVKPCKGDIKHTLIDKAVQELKKLKGGRIKDTPKNVYIIDTINEGIIQIQELKIIKMKNAI